jgi:uncharacterized membrane protein
MDSNLTTTRHWIAALSAVGAANMAVASLRQLGVVHHLPDPPIRGFDSDAVLLSQSAFVFGVPDAPIALGGFLANIPLALLGGTDRTRTRPWIPIVSAATAVAEVSVAAWDLVKRHTRVRSWCVYCLAGATLNGGIAILASREAASALRTPKARLACAAGAVIIAGLAIGFMSLLDARRRATGSTADRSDARRD